MRADRNRKASVALPPEKEIYFRQILTQTREGSRFDEMASYMQHGDTTVREHCIMVAHQSYAIALRHGIHVNEEALIRGALLHDYFLYDWHENTWANKIHGFTHPAKALREAEKDFTLNDIERDMIKHHMFPLTPVPPRTREGWILCIADKICATRETVGDRLRRLIQFHGV